MKHLVFTLSLVIVCPLSPYAQSNDTTHRVDEIFSQWNNATPGVSVAISRGDKILYQKAFGLADLEHNVPNMTQTIFEAGSVSKQFTAAAILLLADEGKLSLADDVHKYVPELPVYQARITIQHLLNHTSGLKDWGTIGALTGWPRTTRVYTQELALEIICRQKSLNFDPGAEYSYSNSNYSLLVTIVERVSQQSLADFTKARFFEPLGMKQTQWRNNFREVIPNRAIAYSKSGDAFIQEMPFENIHGHGGLLTTTQDLLTWNKILTTNVIGGAQFTPRRTQKGKLNNGKEISYAAGLFIDQFNGFEEISHSGATAGYRAWLAYYPQKKLSVVLLSNTGAFNPVREGKKIAEIYLGQPLSIAPRNPKSVPLTPSDLKKWDGTYREQGGFDVFQIILKDGQLNSNGHTLYTVHPDTLYLDGLTWMSTKTNAVLLKNASGIKSYVKVRPYDLSPVAMGSLNGNYYSEEAEAGINIEVKGGEVWFHRKPATAFKLTPSFLDGFTSAEGGLYEFKRDKQGKVLGFEVSQSRAESVPFLKTDKMK